MGSTTSLSNAKYVAFKNQISFRREEGNCKICWYAASITDIDLGGMVTKGVVNVGLELDI